ncbi:MAG: hypothetical protein U0002_12835 [Thermoanaerobaculia bacterium]
MRLSTLSQILFILYCLQAGVLLVLAPWSPSWERLLWQLPLGGFQQLALAPWLRGSVTGLGLVHLVWGAHDLNALFQRRPEPEAEAPAPAVGDQRP